MYHPSLRALFVFSVVVSAPRMLTSWAESGGQKLFMRAYVKNLDAFFGSGAGALY